MIFLPTFITTLIQTNDWFEY